MGKVKHKVDSYTTVKMNSETSEQNVLLLSNLWNKVINKLIQQFLKR